MAIYPPPPYPGGYYHPSPFPYTFSSYPAPASGFFPTAVYGSSSYPSAATYVPYPHPTSMYTTTFPSPAGFYPNWPPLAPDLTPSTAPFPSPSKDDCTYFPLTVAAEDPSSKLADAKLPPGHMLSPSEMPNPSLFVDRTCDNAPAGRVLPELHATKPPARRKTSVLKARTSRESRASSHRTTWASSSTACPPTQSSKAVTGGTAINSKTEEDDDVTPLYDRDIQTEKINFAVHPAFPNFRCQGSDLTKGNNTSGASNSGVHKHTCPKILSMELAEAQFSSAATNASNFYDTGTTASLSENSLSSPSDALATAYVTPQMFDEMPTPQSGYENCCCGNPNKIQSSCVQGGSNNPYEHDFDGQPHHYGFDNLKRQTVIRAYGTEHSFYGLPENYLLDRATLGPLFDAYDDDMDGCSTELVDVFLGTTEQQKSDQFVNCFCEAPNAFSKDTPERVSHAYDVNTKGRSDESVHVFVSPPEQQPYEGEQQESGQLPKCFSKASEIVLPFQQPPMSATATDQMQFQASKSMPNYDVYEKEDSTCINIISGVRDLTIELQQENDERACHCPVMTASNSLVTRSSQLSVDHSMSRLRLLWDPGALAPLHSSKAEPARELGYVAILVPEVMSLCIQDGSYVQKLRDSSCSVLVTHQRRKEWHPGADTIPSSTSTRDNRFYCGVPSRLINHGIQFFWDPGILNQMHIMPLVLSASYKEVTGGCLADQELM